MSDNQKARAEKLVAWDADYYNELTDDDCIVCLSERQIYLVGQVIEQITWERTRWSGDTASLDLKGIAGNLERAIAEKMTCETLTQLAQQVTNLQEQVSILSQIVQGTLDIPPLSAGTTTLDDIFPPAEREAAILAETENCGTADKDAIFAACRAVVTYINNNNVDILENISQAANIPDRIDAIIRSTPLGLLPADEAFGWITFIGEELLQEYEATVTQELLDEFSCGLFCECVANDCVFTVDILIDYIVSRNTLSINLAVDTFADLIQFALTGTFSGTQYFWYFCFVNTWVRAAGQVWFGLNGIGAYETAARTGLNSPDNDWSILCEDCPTDNFEAAIAQVCSVSPVLAGTIDSNPDAGRYILSATVREGIGDYAIVMSDAQSRTWSFVSLTVVSGSFSAYTYCTPTTNGFGSPPASTPMQTIILVSSVPFVVDVVCLI